MGPQSCGSPMGILGFPLGSTRTKCHLDVGPMAIHRLCYKGEGGSFPQVRPVVNLVSRRLLMVSLSTKSVKIMH